METKTIKRGKLKTGEVKNIQNADIKTKQYRPFENKRRKIHKKYMEYQVH